MAKIEHVALWVKDLEKMKGFFKYYFDAEPGEKYANPQKKFSSYFLRFENNTRLEIMTKDDIMESSPPDEKHTGWAHLAIATGSRDKVIEITEKLRKEGHLILGEPRTTGDGYFESVIQDPEGNRIELTI